MTDDATVIVLGVGNILMQDDGVGIWAIRALAEDYELPPQVRLIEGGVAGFDLLAELDGATHLLIVDAVDNHGPPGAVYHLTPENLAPRRGPVFSAHEIGIPDLLSLAEFLGKRPHTRILGVQPLEARAVGLSLTPPLQEALPLVLDAVLEELRAMGVEGLRKKVRFSHA